MNREAMVEVGAREVCKQLGSVPFPEQYARAVLNAVLPQITSVEQLQQVPTGSLLMADHENGFQPEFIRWSEDRPYVLDDQSWWWDTDEEFLAAFSLIQVVWTP